MQGKGGGALPYATRVYQNAKLRISLINRPLQSSYRSSFVVKKQMPKKGNTNNPPNDVLPKSKLYVFETQ